MIGGADRIGAAILAAWIASCAAPAPIAPRPTPRTERAATRTPPAPPPAAASVVLRPEGAEPVRVEVEIARTDRERRRGLMWRRYLPRDRGMLFLFPRAERQSFWMVNTFVPLDMIFIGADRRVVGVVPDATPLTDDERAVEADSQYVLEVRAGFARAHGVGVGTPVTFEAVSMESVSSEELEEE